MGSGVIFTEIKLRGQCFRCGVWHYAEGLTHEQAHETLRGTRDPEGRWVCETCRLVLSAQRREHGPG